MQKYTDVVLDRKGNVVPGATVLIKTLAGALAVIYAENGSSPIFNPISTDSSGRFSFYAVDGRYSLTVSINGVVFATQNDLLIEDPADASVVNITGGTISNTALTNITINGLPPVTQSQVTSLLVTTSTTPPLNPAANAEWINSVTGRHFTRFVDADSSQWVEI